MKKVNFCRTTSDIYELQTPNCRVYVESRIKMITGHKPTKCKKGENGYDDNNVIGDL